MEHILKNVHADREFFNGLGDAYPADDRVAITCKHIEGVTCSLGDKNRSTNDQLHS